MDFYIVDGDTTSRPQKLSLKGLLFQTRWIAMRGGSAGAVWDKKPLTSAQRDEIVDGLNATIYMIEHEFGKAQPLK